MIYQLYKLELFKLRKRLATITVYLIHLVLLFFIYGSLAYAAARYPTASFGLPEAWKPIFERGSTVSVTLAGVMTVLLIASEFDWRTARQNLIDGASRYQWFIARLLLLVTLTVIFFGTQLLFAGVLAWWGTDFNQAGTDYFSVSEVRAVFGFTLSILLYCCLAFVFSLLLRSTSYALGLTLIYPVFDNLVAAVFRGLQLDNIADWFLFQVMGALAKYDQYQPYGSIARESLERQWSTPLLSFAGLAWMTVLMTAIYRHFRNSDI